MKISEVRGMTTPEIESKVDDAREVLFKLRFQFRTGQLTDYSRIVVGRQTIARMIPSCASASWPNSWPRLPNRPPASRPVKERKHEDSSPPHGRQGDQQQDDKDGGGAGGEPPAPPAVWQGGAQGRPLQGARRAELPDGRLGADCGEPAHQQGSALGGGGGAEPRLPCGAAGR